ncbi:MAG: hypothetical protein WCE90_08350 [Candidatus Zixiibacteriota bacterium]
MRKHVFFILLVATIFVFVGAISQSAKAQDDPGLIIKNSKTPVHFHSLAPGDSLVQNQTSMVGTSWMSIYPSNYYPHTWNCIAWLNNASPGLNPSDRLRMQPDAGTTVWTQVEEVTITLKLKRIISPFDSMYVEFTGGYDSLLYPISTPAFTWWQEVRPEYGPYLHIDSVKTPPLSTSDTIVDYWHVIHVDSAATAFRLTLEDPAHLHTNMILGLSAGANPDSVHRARVNPIGTWWHEESPDNSQWWHIDSWRDNGNGYLDSCDVLDFKMWHVEDVAIDIALVGIPDPTVPTMTQWGVIIMVALILASGAFIILRRKKVRLA